MTTRISIHRQAATDYYDWLLRNSQPPLGSLTIAQMLDEEMRDELVRSNGMPVNAVYNSSAPTPCWIWRFNSNTWIRYIVKDRPTGLFGGISRRVIITEISDTRLS